MLTISYNLVMKGLLILIVISFSVEIQANIPGQIELPSIKTTSNQTYELKDLAILESEKNYEEFFLHARDLAPQKRDKNWNDMVTSMARSFARYLVNNNFIDENNFKFIEQLHKWPILNKDEFFTRDRNSIGKIYLEKCYTKSKYKDDKCLLHTLNFWRKDPHYPELGLELAKLGREYMSKNDLLKQMDLNTLVGKKTELSFRMLEFYLPALESPLSEFYCKRSEIKKLIVNEIFGLSTQKSERGLKKFITSTIHDDCWLNVKNWMNDYIRTNDQFYKDAAYKTLSLREDLSTELEDIYLLSYILEYPSPGELFNHSWNMLQSVSRNIKRRELLLKNIKQIDPVPDNVFSSDNSLKKSTILAQIALNFPEFMDYYSSSCLSFLEGKKSFVKGNPTLHCKDFYNLSKKGGHLLPGQDNQFESLLKI